MSDKELLRYYPSSLDSLHEMLNAGIDESITINPIRLSYPYLLFRKIYLVCKKANYEERGVNADAMAVKLLRLISGSKQVSEQWQAFVALCGADYPFLTKLECKNA